MNIKKKIKKSRAPFLTALALYSTIPPVNYGVYSVNYLWSASEITGRFELSKNIMGLLKYQSQLTREIKSPWVFVPGSFLWRLPERPNPCLEPDASPQMFDLKPRIYKKQIPKLHLVKNLENISYV